MAAHSPATLLLQEEELKHQQLLHFQGEGASVVLSSSPPAGAASPRSMRNHPRKPSRDAEVIALSPKTIMAKNQFSCEVCNKGFPREQNLQIHRRSHNMPWKLNKKTNDQEGRKIVYVCPELGCVRHDPSRALGDLSAIKKHFSRKHGEKKFSCERCNKKYAVCSDWKAHSKICGTKEYQCDCGAVFSRYDSFISHSSFCDALAGEVAARRWPYSSMVPSILANASNQAARPRIGGGLALDPHPASMSLGSSAAGLLTPGNHKPLSSPLSVGADFQPIQPPNMPLHPFSEPKPIYPRATDFPGIHGFPSYTTLANMPNFDFNAGADQNSPQNDLNLNINNSFTGLLMSSETSAYNILNCTPFPQFSSPTNIQKAPMTGGNFNNVANMNNMGSSLSGTSMKFNSYGGAWGDEMTGGWEGAAGSTIQGMYNNLNVGGGSTLGYGSGDMEYASDQMNAPYGGMLYNVRNADARLVGELNDNVLVEPEMSVQSEYCDYKLTRDFLGIENGMDSLTASGMDDHLDGYETGIGIETNSPSSEATISAHTSPFFSFGHPDF